jgi:hypothetical protein
LTNSNGWSWQAPAGGRVYALVHETACTLELAIKAVQAADEQARSN